MLLSAWLKLAACAKSPSKTANASLACTTFDETAESRVRAPNSSSSRATSSAWVLRPKLKKQVRQPLRANDKSYARTPDLGRVTTSSANARPSAARHGHAFVLA